MNTRHYQPLQMHRIAYTELSQTQIDAALRDTRKGPNSASTSSEDLAGKTLTIVTDDGPTLSYTFHDGRELTVAENGAAGVRADYGALALKQLVLVSHLVPGTQKGFNLIIDRETQLVTVFEVWFSGYVALTNAVRAARELEPFDFPNGQKHREVQRQVYYGYVKTDAEAPAARHHITNRLEGKGLYWKQDTGIETLEFYCSILSSNFVELTRFGGEMTVCSPSDYIMINEHQFVYSRVEAELSGIFTLHVVDLFDVAQVGVRLGFNEKDVLEYHLYRGSGEVTGQIASFEVFGNNGEEIAWGDRGRPEIRGQRLVYRPLDTFPVMTDAEVRDQVFHHAKAFNNGEGSTSRGMSGYKGPQIMRFVGRQLTVRMDNGGPVIAYDFTSGTQLRWRYEGDANWREAWYEMYEPDGELYFFAHLLDEAFPRQCAMVALDLKNGLSTCIIGETGTPFRNNETTPHFHFGVLEMEGITPPTYQRHHWTDELVGEAVTWNYQPGSPGMTSMHLYTTPTTYSWLIFLTDGSGGMQWSSPGWYAKLREDVFIMAWVEEACNGTLGVICFNRRTMNNAGFDYAVGPDGLSLKVVGARARHAGKFNVEKYLGLVPRNV